MPISEIPEHISVIMLSRATSKADVIMKLTTSKALRVRGKVIAAWARQMAKAYRTQLDPASVAEYVLEGCV